MGDYTDFFYHSPLTIHQSPLVYLGVFVATFMAAPGKEMFLHELTNMPYQIIISKCC